MRALVRPALAVLLLVGVGVTAARRAGRDELAQCAGDVAAACALDATSGGPCPGTDAADAPPTALLDGHTAPALAVEIRQAARPAHGVPAVRATDALTVAPKTSPPTA